MSDAPPNLASQRLVSLDAYRGFVMFLMAAEMLHIPQVAKHFPDSAIWQWLKFHSEHVAWTGCSLHDLIQPSFSFMVGVALPFSLASRLARGQSRAKMWFHALWRSLLLVLLGVFLRSQGKTMTNWTFEDTLSQIGLGYPFLFALGFAGNKIRWSALVVILIGYWTFFALHPLPPEVVDRAAVNIPPDWPHDYEVYQDGSLLPHWNLNTNAAWSFDRWFLNLFPREKEFLGNSGGYATLSFITTLGTMLLGLIAGTWLKAARKSDDIVELEASNQAVVFKLSLAAVISLTLGWLLHVAGICPSVKKIWTPSWVLFSGGWCFLFMAAFYFVLDVLRWRAWAFPLVVIGMNSIAMYVMAHGFHRYVSDSIRTHFGKDAFKGIASWLNPDPAVFQPLISGASVLFILWLVLLWMHRRKIYLRI